LLPRGPERTRLLRLCKPPQDWPQAFLAAPTVLGGLDTYGMALIHPVRAGRRPPQIGRQGLATHRWIVGGNLCLRLQQGGVIIAWACATAHGADHPFPGLRRQCEERLMVLSDPGCQAAAGDPSTLQRCQRGAWPDRLLVETVRAMLTLVCHGQKVRPRGWAYVQARLACTMVAFHVLVQWHG